jgi:hypothetical protein
MKKRWIWPAVVAMVGVAVGIGAYGGAAQATPASTPGFKGTTVANATFDAISSEIGSEASSSNVPAMPGPAWQEMIKTQGRSDLYVQQNTWDPSACHCIPSTGWHTHPGPSFVIVTKGTVTAYDGDDPTCSPHVYTANTANNSFVDPGDGHVHIIRDESGAVAQTVAVQLIAAGATRRQDAKNPGNCPF